FLKPLQRNSTHKGTAQRRKSTVSVLIRMRMLSIVDNNPLRMGHITTPKLKPEDIPVIMNLRKSGMGYRQIADKIGAPAVLNICLGRTWRHLGLEPVTGIRADAGGESSPYTNLSNADIIEIRMLADSGVQKKKIAAIFGVTPSAISR